MDGENVCEFHKYGYCKFQKNCDSKHVNEVCEDTSCDVKNCNYRHPRPCKFYREYGRCKFSEWCFYKHDRNRVTESESKQIELIKKVDQLEKKVNESKHIIEEMVRKSYSFVQKSEIEQLEEMIHEKNIIIESLQEKLSALEMVIDGKNVIDDEIGSSEIHENTFYNPAASVQCEECDFIAKNEKGLKIHKKSKHEHERQEMEKVELNIYALATDEYINENMCIYKKEMEMEIDFIEKVTEIDMDVSKYENPSSDYIGKFLPTRIVIRTRIPDKWKNCVKFRNNIWKKINGRLVEGKIS